MSCPPVRRHEYVGAAKCIVKEKQVLRKLRNQNNNERKYAGSSWNIIFSLKLEVSNFHPEYKHTPQIVSTDGTISGSYVTDLLTAT